MPRIAITGLGISSSIGLSTQDFYQGLIEDRSEIGEIDYLKKHSFAFNIGATIKNLHELKGYAHDKIETRAGKILANAVKNAVEDSQILNTPFDPNRFAIFLTGPACMPFELEELTENFLKEKKTLSDINIKHSKLNSTDYEISQIAHILGITGPRGIALNACSSSGMSIGQAADLIRLGEIDAAIVGGIDGFSAVNYAGFMALQNVSDEACQPFDKDRKGLSFGEGAGILILEDLERAKKRGAPILAEFLDHSAFSEGYNLSAPHPEGLGYTRVMEDVLKRSKVSPDQVDFINAHGTATGLNDKIEALAINKVFNSRRVPVNSIKGHIGHCMGASGAVEAVFSVLALSNDNNHKFVVPGTKNFKTADPEADIEVFTGPRELKKLDYVMCNNAGFGGNNCSLLFKRF